MATQDRDRTDDDFRAEIESHVQIETDRLIAEGLAPDKAATAARRTFGNATRARERFYESRRLTWLDDLRQDLRFTLRSLRRSPGFAIVALLTLAVGLGANTAVFSVLNAVLLRPLPYRNAERLVLVEIDGLGGIPDWVRPALRTQADDLEDFTGFQTPTSATLVTNAGPVSVRAAMVTANFFSMLGIAPAAGTLFGDEASAPPNGAVLTYGFWRRQFGGDPSIVGRSITLTGTPLTIVGVIGDGFRFPTALRPGTPALDVQTQPDVIQLADARQWLTVIGRLRPGSTPASVAAEVKAAFVQESPRRFTQQYANGAAVTATPLQERLVGETRPRLLLLMGAVGCVLLVVCANVANLLLARTYAREHELAIRAALGARTGRLVRLMLTESLLLAIVGAAAAVLLARWTAGIGLSLVAERVPYVGTIPVDRWVLLFDAAIAVLVGVLSGLASAITIRSDRFASISSVSAARTSTSRMHLRRGILVLEVALTFVLVVTSALLLRTLWNLYHANRGFTGAQVVTASVEPNLSGTIPAMQPRLSAFFELATERVMRLPGVTSAAAASAVPLSGASMSMAVSLAGESATTTPLQTPVATVTPRYFTTIGTRLLTGRDFQATDVDGAERVAIVNDALRRALAPRRALIGDRLTFGKVQLTIVGVVEDTPTTSLREPTQPFVFIPLSQVAGTPFAWGRLVLLVRTQGVDRVSLVPAIRQAVWALGSDIVINQEATMSERLDASMRTERTTTLLLSCLGGIALVLAIAGVYGVVAYAVVQRTREIGVRLALGAGRGHVIGSIVQTSMRPVALGIAIGAALAIVATRAVASLLFHVTPTDIRTFAFTAVVVAATGLAAAWIPARRAARIDPVSTLRAE
ncbi:MAG TPA: ABC transporter permease [Vicinamibacterales bacterium]|jgi:predicted permease|nr:ABC transporter permease [Vicinamibacterales bacterium]